MKKIHWPFLWGAFALAALSFGGPSSQASVYGDDSRISIALAPPAVQTKARALALEFSSIFLKEGASPNTASLDFLQASNELGYTLCPEERYAGEPSAAPSCTGFLIDDDILLTAGHCVTRDIANQERTPFCQDFQWVFDYQTDAAGRIDLNNISRDAIVGCKEVIRAEFTYKQDLRTNYVQYFSDFAVVRLDRSFPDRPKLNLANRPAVVGDELSAMGYPLGLPAKYVSGAEVLPGAKKPFFRTNLDTFEGNSGSPVLNRNLDVVGIISHSWVEDYVWDEKRSCRYLSPCARDASQCDRPVRQDQAGEFATSIEVVRQYLPQKFR